MALRSAALDAPPQTPQQLPFHPNNGDFEVKLSAAPSATVPGAIAFGNKRRTHAEMTAGERVVVDDNHGRVKRLKVIPPSPPASSDPISRKRSRSDSPCRMNAVKRIRVKLLPEGGPRRVTAARPIQKVRRRPKAARCLQDSAIELFESSSSSEVDLSVFNTLLAVASACIMELDGGDDASVLSAFAQTSMEAVAVPAFIEEIAQPSPIALAAEYVSAESSKVLTEDAPLLALADLVDAAQDLEAVESLLGLSGYVAPVEVPSVEEPVKPSAPAPVTAKPKAKKASRKVPAATRSRSSSRAAKVAVAAVPRRVTRSMTKKAL